MAKTTKQHKGEPLAPIEIPPEVMSDFAEVLSAISARVRIASARIRAGRPTESLAALEQLERVLPLPKAHNWQAAKDAADRGKS